jgi:hypothetical protein
VTVTSGVPENQGAIAHNQSAATNEKSAARPKQGAVIHQNGVGARERYAAARKKDAAGRNWGISPRKNRAAARENDAPAANKDTAGPGSEHPALESPASAPHRGQATGEHAGGSRKPRQVDSSFVAARPRPGARYDEPVRRAAWCRRGVHHWSPLANRPAAAPERPYPGDERWCVEADHRHEGVE